MGRRNHTREKMSETQPLREWKEKGRNKHRLMQEFRNAYGVVKGNKREKPKGKTSNQRFQTCSMGSLNNVRTQFTIFVESKKDNIGMAMQQEIRLCSTECVT